MRSLSDTIGRLAALRSQRQSDNSTVRTNGLVAVRDFGSNPGALDGWCYVPDSVRDGAPLVVVLHGCTQDAAHYDKGSGWSQLADRYGFAVLFPEQRRTNNMNLCFNWYETGDSMRGEGEPLSIVQMIAAMVDWYGLDPARVYVNGLSAGGAMTSVMLATYPEIFAGGAIIAGLAFGSATGVPQAFDRMRGHGIPAKPALAGSVRAASPHQGPWPAVSIWHGGADHIVDSSNGDAVLTQWRAVHGLADKPDRTGTVDGYPHRVWHNADGIAVIEEYRIAGMGHGTPLATKGDDGIGTSGAHMLEVGISSTRHIASFWGLLASERRLGEISQRIPMISHQSNPAQPAIANDVEPTSPAASASGVGKVIEDALRAAGLMR